MRNVKASKQQARRVWALERDAHFDTHPFRIPRCCLTRIACQLDTERVTERNSGSSRLNSRVTLKAVVLLSGVLTLVFLISFLFSKEGISELQQSRYRVAELQRDIERLRAENQALAAQINNLRDSTFSVEKIAREDLGMAKDGEIVYVVEEKEENDK